MHSSKGSLKIRELFPLGRGGMGVTYLGCSRAAGGFERLVVIKRLHEHLQEDERACRRLAEEAELAGAVRHVNVVPVLHVDRDDRGTFLVLDYVEGASLFGLRRLAKGRIPEAVVLRMMLDSLAGLEAIHTATDHLGRSLRILHRDISPENILVSVDGMTRLTDFGIAKSDASEVMTEPSQLIGKITYMAPEYLERKKIGPSLDIYSLGVTFWTMLAGHSPWVDLEEAQILARALTVGVPELPAELSLSEEVRKVVRKACAQSASDRYQTAQEMALALKEAGKTTRVADHSEVAGFVQEYAKEQVARVRNQAAKYLSMPSVVPAGISPAPESAPPRAAADATRQHDDFIPKAPKSGFDRESMQDPDSAATRGYRPSEKIRLVASSRRIQVARPEETGESVTASTGQSLDGSLSAYAVGEPSNTLDIPQPTVASDRATPFKKVLPHARLLAAMLLVSGLTSASLMALLRGRGSEVVSAPPSVEPARAATSPVMPERGMTESPSVIESEPVHLASSIPHASEHASASKSPKNAEPEASARPSHENSAPHVPGEPGDSSGAPAPAAPTPAAPEPVTPPVTPTTPKAAPTPTPTSEIVLANPYN